MKGIICGNRCDDGKHDNTPCDGDNAMIGTLLKNQFHSKDHANESVPFTVYMIHILFCDVLDGRFRTTPNIIMAIYLG